MKRTQRQAAARIERRQRPEAMAEAFEAAARAFETNDLARAESLYRGILKAQPDHAPSLHHLGLVAWRRGHSLEAAEHIEAALRLRPDDAQAWSNLGVMLLGQGRAEAAVAACRRTIALRPDHAAAWSNLGNGLRALGRTPDAVAAYREALALRPDFPEALTNLGDTLRCLDDDRLGPDEGMSRQARLDEALDACRRATLLAPSLAAAHFALGHVQVQLCEIEAAAAAFAEGLRHEPRSASGQTDFGNVLRRLGRHEESEAAHRRAIALDPGRARAWIDLAALYKTQGRLEPALAALEQALAAEPACADAYCDRGGVLLALKRLEEAAAACRAAIAIEAGFAEAHANLGAVLHQQKQDAAAIASYRRALSLKPALAEIAVEICMLRRGLCDWEDLERESVAALARCAALGRPAPPFASLCLIDSPADHYVAARAWARAMAPAEGMSAPAPQGARAAGGRQRLRIGYLSSDFHQHATATLVAGLFECHDRAGFEIFGYSFGPDDGSDIRHRLLRALDHVVDLGALSHAEAAARIRADAIDILVDLKGYTQDCRPAILALRPAPIQVGFLGYPGTMGADFIDYLLVDPIVAPPGQQHLYTEKLAHLPQCYQPNDRWRRIAAGTPSRAACGLPQDGFVFCCFNTSSKITPAIFDIWMRLLAEVPQAVLWLLDTSTAAKDNLRREAAARGVAPERLVFGARLAPADHLARLALADLFLDTLPYNAHTVGSEALWAGLPLLTCAGQAFAGRVGASLLAAAGLPELVAESLADYEAAALFLARTPAVLATLRTRLMHNRHAAPLFDTPQTTIDLESAYRTMKAFQDAGLQPQSFAVERQRRA